MFSISFEVDMKSLGTIEARSEHCGHPACVVSHLFLAILGRDPIFQSVSGDLRW